MIDDFPSARSYMRTGTSTARAFEAVHQDVGVHLRVVRGVMVGVERDQPPVDREEARGRVGHAVPGGQVDEEAEEPDAEDPWNAPPVLRFPEEAGPDDRVRPARQDRLEDLRDVLDLVLPVPVDPHDDIVAAIPGIEESGLHRAADPEVARQVQHGRARLPRGFGGPVRGPVVHDEHVVGVSLPERADQPPDRPLLLVRRDDHQYARRSSFHPGIHIMNLSGSHGSSRTRGGPRRPAGRDPGAASAPLVQ